MALGSDKSIENTDQAPANERTVEKIAMPSRRNDGSVTHGPDAILIGGEDEQVAVHAAQIVASTDGSEEATEKAKAQAESEVAGHEFDKLGAAGVEPIPSASAVPLTTGQIRPVEQPAEPPEASAPPAEGEPKATV